jgi:hypothetical protein
MPIRWYVQPEMVITLLRPNFWSLIICVPAHWGAHKREISELWYTPDGVPLEEVEPSQVGFLVSALHVYVPSLVLKLMIQPRSCPSLVLYYLLQFAPIYGV